MHIGFTCSGYHDITLLVSLQMVPFRFICLSMKGPLALSTSCAARYWRFSFVKSLHDIDYSLHKWRLNLNKITILIHPKPHIHVKNPLSENMSTRLRSKSIVIQI